MNKQYYILFFTLLLCAGSYAQDKSWTPETSMQVKTLSQTALSPDGKYTAYVVREPLMEGEQSEYLSHIWVAANDGSFNTQYTRGEHSSYAPAFSPDGQQIAFLSARGEQAKTQIWLMRVFGGEPLQLTEVEGGINSFQWSPDGSRIAFTQRDPDTEEEKARKKEKRDVILVDKNFKNRHLYTVLLKESDDNYPVQQITEGQLSVNSFDWSPDGTTIAFEHQPNPGVNARYQSDIATVPADSGAIQPVIEQPGSDGSPNYSPDGKTLAFVSHGGTLEPIGLGDLYIVPAKGGKAKKLMNTPNRSANLIDWTPDGQSVMITEAMGTSTQVLNVPVSGKEATVISSNEITFEGDDESQVLTKLEPGVFSSVAFDAGMETMAMVYENLQTPAEVYTGPVKNFSKQQLSHINDNLDLPEMARTELIRWTSKDGLPVEGLLTYPKGYERGKKYPVILQIHGGPAGVFSQRFNGRPSIYMTEYFAEKGYATIKPNPRGSTGYGKDFRYANFKDWGYGDYEDVVSGVDKVLEMGIGDPDQQFVMGWSYGGYMTSFVVTRTDRFKAASMGAGLPNLISMVTTTDISDYLVGHMGDEFWNDYETYEKHSAIYRLNEIVTPTQIIHGQNDLRVPFTQGQEFYEALKRKGVDTEMIVYPRTPHGPREPKFLMDVSDRILTWFEQYRGGEGEPVSEKPGRE